MSLFERVAKVFKGVDEKQPEERPGRNEPCWCGSGRKYKKCHLPEDERRIAAASCSLNCGPT
jgi:hypothetical protein